MVKIPKWLWWKKYFDTGYGLTNYLKWPLLALSLLNITENMPIYVTFIVGISWFIFAFFLGRWWIISKYADCENEINNQINPFQSEVRIALKNKRFK